MSTAAVAALVVAALVVAAWPGDSATAGASTPFHDPASLGGLAMYDDTGALLTSGPDDAQWARFVVAATAGRDTAAAPVVLSVATVETGEPPAAWPVAVLVGAPGTAPATATPAGLPARLLPLAGSVLDTQGALLAQALTALPAQKGDAPAHLQLRMSDSTRPDAAYWSTFVDIDPMSERWTLGGSGTDSVAPGLATPQLHRHGGAVTVTSSVTTHGDAAGPTGWVELFDGDTDRGSAAYNPWTGAITAVDVPATMDCDYHFVLSPVDSVDEATYTSPHAQCSQSATSAGATPAGSAPTGTTADGARRTRLAVEVIPARGRSAYGTTVISVAVTPAVARGVVTLHGGTTFLASVPIIDGRGRLTTNSLGAGRHVIVARFVPSDRRFASSSGRSAAFDLVPALGRAAAGSVVASVVPGPLTISTPYGPGRPLKLGSLGLASDGSKLIAATSIGTVGRAAMNGIRITDSRAGDTGWAASLVASDPVNGDNTISAQNLGLVGVHAVAVPGDGGGRLGSGSRPVVTQDLPPSVLVVDAIAAGSHGLARDPKVFASAAHGAGSVYICGRLVLQAPTSATAGDYAATLTFTVS